jgi:metal-responsive CopG/Arc/MetJ family transcriptional regulator
MGKQLIGAQADNLLVNKIDEAAKRLGVNRSEFIRKALDAYLADTQPSA